MNEAGLRVIRETLTKNFFQRLKKNLLPRIKADSGRLTYRPFEDFISMIRRMYRVAQKNDGTLAFSYDTQIDSNGWRKTSKKELSRRSKLTVYQIRTCLRLAEKHGIVERRSKGKGKKKGSDLRIRPNFRILEDMLRAPEDSHKLAREKSESYDWPSAEDQSVLKTAREEGALDGGNFPRPCIYTDSSSKRKKERDNEEIKKHSSSEELHYIKFTEEEEQVERGALVAEDSRDCIRHAYCKVLVEIDAEGLLRASLSASGDGVFEIRNDEMEIVRYLQGRDMNLIGFPTKENVNSRIRVRWTPSLLKLFLKRVRQDGLSLSFFRSYFFHFQNELEVPHICLPTFRKLLEVFPKFRNFFDDRRRKCRLEDEQLWAENFIGIANSFRDDEVKVILQTQVRKIRHDFGRNQENPCSKKIFYAALEHYSKPRSFELIPNGWLLDLPFFVWKHEDLIGSDWVEAVLSAGRERILLEFETSPRLIALHRRHPEFLRRVFGDDWRRDQALGALNQSLVRFKALLQAYGPYRGD